MTDLRFLRKSGSNVCIPNRPDLLGLDKIVGMLEDSSSRFIGMMVEAYWQNEKHSVRVPITDFSDELIAYMRFRLMIPATPAIQKLPIKIQNLIRVPVDRHMERWIRDGNR